MATEKSREEQIKMLSEQLLKLLETPSNEISTNDKNSYTKTINDLKNGLNVDVDHVKKIMRRVDEVYGHANNYITTRPLFEEFDDLTKNGLNS